MRIFSDLIRGRRDVQAAFMEIAIHTIGMGCRSAAWCIEIAHTGYESE
jgi:hypothetical protein